MVQFPPTDAEAYKALARSWAATVTVVTARRAGRPKADDPSPESPQLDGFTCTAFLMASIVPPIVVVSAASASNALTMMREAAAVAINFLGIDQSAVSAAFARSAAARAGVWTELAWDPDADGAPILRGAAGAFSCKPRQFVDAGDHTLVLADVTAIHRPEGPEAADTLVYHNRGYGRVARLGE
jgi:3-hydroxy-9,10-secoandrosta-1,3,5(10)-triene-9,17-dione monooxygenase reductase component